MKISHHLEPIKSVYFASRPFQNNIYQLISYSQTSKYDSAAKNAQKESCQHDFAPRTYKPLC